MGDFAKLNACKYYEQYIGGFQPKKKKNKKNQAQESET